MEPDFWHKKWSTNDIGFHQQKVNPLLIQHLDQLSLSKGHRVFLPLCGKTLDLIWLLEKGYQVAGAELSELAIQQLFEALAIEPEVINLGDVHHYKAENIDIFVGDIFKLSAELLGVVNAVYDRAALVALPEMIRKHYSRHLSKITKFAPQLIISYEYEQNVLSGPPFSISHQELHQHYATTHTITLLSSIPIEGGLKGKVMANEDVWLLERPAR